MCVAGHAAAEDRAGHDRRRRDPSGLDVGLPAQRSDHVRECRRSHDDDGRLDADLAGGHGHGHFDQSLSWKDVEWLRFDLGRADRAEGDPDRRRCQAGGRDGRSRNRTLQPRWSPTRRRTGAARVSSNQCETRSVMRVTIICDGGVRRGSDIVKAIALGADAVVDRSPVPLRPRRSRRARRRPAAVVHARGHRTAPWRSRDDGRSPRSTGLWCGVATRPDDRLGHMSDRVLISISDGVADVTFNRADKRNALDNAMFMAIAEAGEQLKSERGVRAVVLSGDGRLVLCRARLLVVPGHGRRRRRDRRSAACRRQPRRDAGRPDHPPRPAGVLGVAGTGGTGHRGGARTRTRWRAADRARCRHPHRASGHEDVGA